MIEQRSHDIIERWLDRVRSDADAARVPLTDLRDGIHDYLAKLAELLRGRNSLRDVAVSAWSDVAREHAITRVRLGFDVTQLFHELVLLRQTTLEVLRGDGAEHDEMSEGIQSLIDAAIATSIKSYIDHRDYLARCSEAQHIGFITHELKNPLAACVMATDQLRSQGLTPAQERFVEIIARNHARLKKLVDNVLLTERLEVGEVHSRPVDLRLGQLLDDTVEQFRRVADSKHIRLDARYDPQLEMHADPELTSSALQNLLDNAIKYTDAGEVSLDIEDLPRQVVFHVRDHCGGLSSEELHVIFEPFKRAHTRKPGSGLGLAIARRSIEVQGGTIHAESAAEGGCHFWFTLPKVHH